MGRGAQGDGTNEPAGVPVGYKPRLGRAARALRFAGSVLDPRAWLHLARLVHNLNVTHVRPRRRLRIGPGASISPTARFANPDRITAGRGLRLGDGCHLWAGHAAGRIVMGDDVMCGPGVLVTAASYRYDDGHPVTAQAMDEADVVIGNDVWLATRAVVLPGARIGDGAIVAAHAVVRGEVPPMAIVAGAPARVVSERRIAAPDPPP